MKTKTFILSSLFILIATIAAFAQVKEVKRITSRIACYDNCEEQYDSKKTYGFEYENLNNFSVTVEAEKWRNCFCFTNSGAEGFLVDTKTFILLAGEKYIWKVDLTGETGTGCSILRKDAYYTKFKAYKNE